MHVVGTAGHVDHGKSTLVKALTGMDPDRFEEEKARGLTIDLGFAWLTLPSGREMGVVDVPGHERFIRNMLAGVGGIDACLFVVAADEGWMPQSSEHLAILDFLQVRAGIVALTKSDLVDDDTCAIAAEEVDERVAGTILEGAPIVPVSATTRQGLPELLEAVDAMLEDAGPSPDRGRPRLFVDRSFSIVGAGTVVTGTLTGGTIRLGDELEVLPSGEAARVRGLQTHRKIVESAEPGSRVAVNLAGLERSEVRRGDAVVRPGDFPLSDTFAARVRAARSLDHPIAEKGAYELFVGSSEVPCRLKFLEEPDSESSKVPGLAPGAEMLVQVFCMRALPLEPHDRFIVRDVGRWETVAGGVVIDHFPGRVRRGDEEVLDRLRARERSSREHLVVQLVAERGVAPLASLGPLTGLGAQAVEEAVTRASSSGQLVRLPSHAVSAAHAKSLLDRSVDLLDAHHEDRPIEPGLAREALRASLDLPPRLFAELVDRWVEEEQVAAEGAVLRRPGHRAALSEDQTRERDRVLQALRDGGASPPELAELGVSTDLVKALERTGEVVLVSPQVAYASDVMAGIERAVVRLISADGPATVAQVRDAIGTTRKYAVPLLEHLDSSGVTRRQGDVRDLGPKGRQLAGE